MQSIARGACQAVFIYDIAFAIDLGEAERRISSARREAIKHTRRAPKYFEYHPAPLRITQGAESIAVTGDFKTQPHVQLVLYDFGAVSVVYRIDIAGESVRLLSLSESLYENEPLLKDSRRRLDDLMKLIGPAVSRPIVSEFVEDYFIFQIDAFVDALSIEDLTKLWARDIAQILRAETRELSADEVSDAMSHRISFGKDDVAIVDWNAAMVVDKDPDDVIAVLEFANVELLEMRLLDQRLDDALGLAYDRLLRQSQRWFQFSHSTALRDVSQWQVDSAILFEGVNNVLKLLGDQYLARLYRLAAQRFHLTDWDGSIIRKLETLDGIYQKISDALDSHRMEVLEWIVILLIAAEILLPFISRRFH
jgi:hypothetical protein